MAIYTKTGDRGITSLFSGKRISKSSKLIAAIGAIDELNSYLGIVGGLTDIQRTLFSINAILTGAKLKFSEGRVQKLKEEIDKQEKTLPRLKNFIIYGGSKKAVEIFYARALTRRAERAIVALKIQNSRFQILAYINRLSDYLFVLARYTNFKSKIKEKIWRV